MTPSHGHGPDDGSGRSTRGFTYAQTTRSMLTITDPAALVRAGASCLQAHGSHTARSDGLPPAVPLDASAATETETAEDVSIMDDPALGALWQLLECGRHDPLGKGLAGVRMEVVNHDGSLAPGRPGSPPRIRGRRQRAVEDRSFGQAAHRHDDESSIVSHLLEAA